jgi:hypothetical protein
MGTADFTLLSSNRLTKQYAGRFPVGNTVKPGMPLVRQPLAKAARPEAGTQEIMPRP